MKSPLITLCLTASTLEGNLRQLKRYRPFVQALELRIDLLHPEERKEAGRLADTVDIPVIATLRLPADGGSFTGTAAERQDLLSRALDHRFWAVDLEENSPDQDLEEKARRNGIRVIRSLHDFNGVPEDLCLRMTRMARNDNEILKGAVMPRCWADMVRLLDTAESLAGREKILLAMGETGFPSRILASRFGSLLTFTSSSEETIAAPGQIDPEILATRYRFKTLRHNSPVYGIIGQPVSHSRSPELHNRWLDQKGLDGVYLPFPVSDPADFLCFARALPVSGFSVTIPHKEAVIPLLDDIDAAVEKIGACNTVYRRQDRWLGTNTDAPGFLEPLLEALNRKDLKKTGATVIGAGGAARAVVHALTEAGARVLILNRTEERGRRLARDFGCEFEPLKPEALLKMENFRDILVQTTNAGMSGHGEEQENDPLPFYLFKGTEILYDIIYTPPVTPLMERARQAGCTVLGGYPMLERQALRQFGLFTGEGMPQ